MYMNSSAGRAGVVNNAKGFEVGFAPLPYYNDVIQQPLNSIIGGATLWTLKGRPEEEYKGVAKFYTYLQKPEVQADWHQFQILTKRAERLEKVSGQLDWSRNIWMGVSVENEQYLDRIDQLRRSGAQVKFLSIEPLLAPLGKVNLGGIDWVIVGGESGPGARPMNHEWVSSIRDQCQQAGVAFFFKQWGGVQKKKTGRSLDGRTWDEMPAQLVALA